jgi:hypothetical protein
VNDSEGVEGDVYRVVAKHECGSGRQGTTADRKGNRELFPLETICYSKGGVVARRGYSRDAQEYMSRPPIHFLPCQGSAPIHYATRRSPPGIAPAASGRQGLARKSESRVGHPYPALGHLEIPAQRVEWDFSSLAQSRCAVVPGARLPRLSKLWAKTRLGQRKPRRPPATLRRLAFLRPAATSRETAAATLIAM